MLGNKALPDFGCLRGAKVVHATSNIAGPFGAEVLAEHGADVLWLENARAPDPARLSKRRFFDTERQNQRTLAIDIPGEQGREIFARIIREADDGVTAPCAAPSTADYFAGLYQVVSILAALLRVRQQSD